MGGYALFVINLQSRHSSDQLNQTWTKWTWTIALENSIIWRVCTSGWLCGCTQRAPTIHQHRVDRKWGQQREWIVSCLVDKCGKKASRRYCENLPRKLRILAQLNWCLALLWAMHIYDANDKKKALQMLQTCLDTEILISVKSCKFCEQVQNNGVDMLKCSFCNVTRFCNKVCQKGAYCKRLNLNMGIILSHGSLCPLLKIWKQIKKGNATVKSCVEHHLIFLQTCDPLRKILDKNDFVHTLD